MHVVSKLDAGGLENGIVNLANHFDKDTFRIEIVCLHGLGKLAERIKPSVKTLVLNTKEGNFVKQFSELYRLFLHKRPRIVHTHGWGQGSFVSILAARLAGVAIVINGEHGSFFLKPHQVFLQRLVYKLCNSILSVSDSLKNEIVSRLNIRPDKVFVIQNGVDTEIFCGKNHAQYAKSVSVNSPKVDEHNGFKIVCIGSLKKSKNQMLLLRAAKLLKPKIGSLRFRVFLVGEGNDREKLEAFVEESSLTEEVQFLGLRNDIPYLLYLANVLVLPSLSGSEGLSNVILEAMSSGIPVIATNSIGSNELVKEGFNGYIIEDNDELLSCRIRDLILNQALATRMGFNARQYVIKNYSLKKMIDGYFVFYSKLAGLNQ
ncbi:MAG: glycosyltransferase [Prolixibacteraceae bacterium]|nr:glycosyltransferase [Prolixibacteraceae bacterium]